MSRVQVVAPEEGEQPSRRKGVRLELDGELWLRVTAEELLELGVHDGDELDLAGQHELERSLAELRARRFVIRSLAARAQSVAELRAKLAQREIPDDIAEEAIDRARGYGYIDDAELATQLARGHRARGYGAQRAALALKQRGIDPAVAKATLETVFDAAEEHTDAARALGTRSFGEGAAARSKAVAFLVRRGFSSRTAWAVVNARERDARDD